MDKHFAKILILCFEEKAKIITRPRKKSKQKWAGTENQKMGPGPILIPF